ncbi:hypothetical protein [Methylobacillus glycogenes]|uniref:hypothetical protein n=1 Tax=Methylobacillus glycogenes TaxID=406 RepID=UPI0011DC77BB|nr:hypothetical protein [Methylobacillus glycogenes]
MQSQQESVLEEFFQKSFGAQLLFKPIKYRKGSAHREPADLIWVNGSFVSLFYMTSSNVGLEKESLHNLKQANGYLRLWKSGKPTYALRGKNRFHEECFVPFITLKKLVIFSIISTPSGVHVDMLDNSHIHIRIPEILLHWVASFGGSICDLLNISRLYFIEPKSNDLTNDSEFSLLRNITHSYVDFCNQLPRIETRKLNPLVNLDSLDKKLENYDYEDFSFVRERLLLNRIPEIMGKALNGKSAKDGIARCFCDMSLKELNSLSYLCDIAVTGSNKNFEYFSYLSYEYHYKFLVFTANIYAKNFNENFKKSFITYSQ